MCVDSPETEGDKSKLEDCLDVAGSVVRDVSRSG